MIKFPLLNNSSNNQITEMLRFKKLANFQNLTIRKIIKIPQIYNLVNYQMYSECSNNLNKHKNKE